MTIADRGTAFATRPGTYQSSACFPGVCVTPSGRWLVTFRAAPLKDCVPDQHTMLTVSDDCGKTWSEPREPWSPQPIAGKPGAFRAGQLTSLGGDRLLAILYWVDVSDPSLPFFNEETEGLLDSRLFLSLSENAGDTWSEPALIDTTPYTMPTPITGPALALANGDWGLQFETNKHYYDTSVWQHASVLMFSSDGGRTWPEHAAVATDPDARIFWWDQRPAVLNDGRVLDLFWTFDRQAAAYLNIHARASEDSGRTWGELWDTGVPGQPAPAVDLGGGRLAMVYVDRTGAPQIKCRVSDDGGRSWPETSELTLHGAADRSQNTEKGTMQDAWSEMSRFSVGLPATARLGDGRFLVAYYAGPETDVTSIEWAVVAEG